MECGIENLWKRGISHGRRSHPYFVKYVTITYFKAFLGADAYVWSDKKFLYIDKRDQPWDILPYL